MAKGSVGVGAVERGTETVVEVKVVAAREAGKEVLREVVRAVAVAVEETAAGATAERVGAVAATAAVAARKPTRTYLPILLSQ